MTSEKAELKRTAEMRCNRTLKSLRLLGELRSGLTEKQIESVIEAIDLQWAHTKRFLATQAEPEPFRLGEGT